MTTPCAIEKCATCKGEALPFACVECAGFGGHCTAHDSPRCPTAGVMCDSDDHCLASDGQRDALGLKSVEVTPRFRVTSSSNLQKRIASEGRDGFIAGLLTGLLISLLLKLW